MEQKALFAKTRFNYQMSIANGLASTPEIRKAFLDDIDQKLLTFEMDAQVDCMRYVSTSASRRGLDAARKWLAENWAVSKAAIVEDWKSLGSSVREGVSHVLVTQQERLVTIKALSNRT